MRTIEFTKMHGIGNDYIYIDCFKNPAPADPPALSRHLSRPHFSVGADGIILIEPSNVADAAMRVFNADGSEAMMCGNGVRCVAKYVYDAGYCTNRVLRIDTKSGVKPIEVNLEAGKVVSAKVDMGEPAILFAEKPVRVCGEMPNVTGVSMGNPHAVLFVDEIPDDVSFCALGEAMEHHELFPDRANVEFVKVHSPTQLEVRVWERGSGETLACGTGACASAVAARLNGYADARAPVAVQLRGGELLIHWNPKDNRVYMEGPAQLAFRGSAEVPDTF